MPDYYPDTESQSGDAKPKGDGKDEQPETETALIPKALLGGKKFDVGEEVVLKIVHDHGDEVEVEYASEGGDKLPKEKSEGGDEPGSAEMGEADSKLESMAQ